MTSHSPASSPGLPKLPELPEPDGYAAIAPEGTHSIVVRPDQFGTVNGYAIYIADQMNTHGRACYEAGSAAAAQAAWRPIGWQFRFVFPTHASNWKGVLELPMSEMGAGNGYHYETRLVYAAAPTGDRA